MNPVGRLGRRPHEAEPLGGINGPENLPEPPSSRRCFGHRVRIWLRRLGISALAAFVAVTAFSLIFNALTRPPALIAPSFGKYVQVGASAVHYERWGKSGTAVVLVPGFLEPSVVWSAVGPMLGEKHVVYALDLPGDGYTRYAGQELLKNESALVDGFLKTLRLRRPILVGHSLGAAVVGDVALEHPRDVSEVIFADGDGLKLGVGPRWLRSAILNSPYMTTLLRIGSRWTWADKGFIQMTCGSQCPRPSTGLTEQWVRPLRQLADEHALHSLLLNADIGLTPEQISAIAVPSAIIWGSDDHDGGSLSDTVVNLHHPPVHMLNGAGHLTMIANPTAFARAVDSR